MNWLTGELRQEKSQHREGMGPCGQEQEREKHEEGGKRRSPFAVLSYSAGLAAWSEHPCALSCKPHHWYQSKLVQR